MANIPDRFENYKILYLAVLAVALFAIALPELLAALLALQLGLWFAGGLGIRGLLQSTRRLWMFFLLITLSFAFVATGDAHDRWQPVPVLSWSVSVNLSGLALAGLMCLRVLVLVMASAWLQQTCASGALVRGLRRLHIPETVAITVDATLAILGNQRPGGGRHGGGQGGGRGDRGGGHGGGQGDGGGGAGGKDASEPQLSWADVRRGKLEVFSAILHRSLERARSWLGERYPELGTDRLRDLSVVLAISLTVIGLKVLQVLPGLPFASGHKNLLVVPLLLYAARYTGMRFGGFAAGTAIGIVSFLLGYGKYGVLEIAHFAFPGLLADLLLPMVRDTSNGARLLQFAVVGALMGIGRFAGNFLAILLAGAPDLAFLLFAPLLVSQVTFGALSCFVCVLIIKPKKADGPVTTDAAPHP